MKVILLAAEVLVATGAGAQVRLPTPQGVLELEAKQQRKEGNVFIADGDVNIRYQNLRLRADHVEYDAVATEAFARGNVRFDYASQHLEADQARYNVKTGRGAFFHVRGTVKMVRQPNPNVLLSPNPLYFEAEEVDRLDEQTYKFRAAWLTICLPDKPNWKFYTRRATLRVDRTVALIHANFRLFHVPLIYLPYASVPAGRKLRQSGFLLPEVSNSSQKGFVLGDSFYWAPKAWVDLELGAQLFSKRGWSQNVDFRATPWDNTRLEYRYFGVVDRGLPGPNGVRFRQGGHQSRLTLNSMLPGGWRAVADLDQLSSLIFRLAFATTFAEATVSEVHSAAFVTNNFRGFSLNFSALNYKNFLSAQPETQVVLRSAPGVRFSSVEQAPWRRWPIYFGFHVFADAVHRSESCNAGRPSCIGPGGTLLSQQRFETPTAVQRTEIAPQVTIPLRWGPWLGVTPTFMLRTTRYGSQLLAGTVVGDSLRRTTAEATVDIRPPSLARVWERPTSKWKHTIEPEVVYHFVNGVNHFERFIRFDENETLTNTNEVEYGITQRLYRRTGDDQADELISWRVAQKYYFDPTFGGALVRGQRNVFQALDSITGYAFADTPRRVSPIVSDLRVSLGGRYDVVFRTDYDPVRGKMNAVGTLLNLHPYHQSFINIGHFSVQTNPDLQPRENQIRVLVGWGQTNRRGWNSAFAMNYDVRQHLMQNQVFQISYNGNCCGITFESRRFALGPVRSGNQFRMALLIANIGTFGTLRRQERLF